MKRLLVILFVLACATAHAQAPRYWPTWMDETGQMRNTSASSPMPVSANISVSNVTVASCTMYSVSPTSVAVTALPSRQVISFFYPASGGADTVWINPGGSVAVPGQGVPLYPGGFLSLEVGSVVPIAIVSSSSVQVTVYQGGN